MSARDSRAPAPIRTANRAPDILRRPLEVEDAERGPEVPVRLRLEVERRAARPTRRTSRLSAALAPDRHARVRQVRQRQQPRAALLLDRVELGLELLDLLAALAVGREDGARVAPLPLRARDLVAGRVLLALQPLDLAESAARAARLERGERLEVGVGVEAAVPEAGRARRPGGRGRRLDRAWLSDTRSGCQRHAVRARDPRTDSPRSDARDPPSAKPSSPPPASAPASCPPPRRSRRRCCPSWTSRSSSTASRRRSPPASTTSSSSPAAARTRSRTTSTSSVELETFLEARGKTELLGRDPQDLEPDQLRLRPAGRAARPRPRRAGHARAWSATSRSPSSSATT